MNRIAVICLTIILSLNISSCSGQKKDYAIQHLSTNEFADKVNELPNTPLIDVRTPEEFNQGHLRAAINIDWNGDNFESKIKVLDKNKPVLIYCRSGGRSTAAVKKMIDLGFTNIYELDNGIMEWIAFKLPIE